MSSRRRFGVLLLIVTVAAWLVFLRVGLPWLVNLHNDSALILAVFLTLVFGWLTCDICKFIKELFQ